ncbi:MAG: hypothetical protein RJB01_601 [Actinomycetota bacterium]
MTVTPRSVVVPIVLAIVLIVISGAALFVGAADSSQAVIMDVRLPRVIVGITLGAALAVAGAVMQGSLQNPLADPSIIGVSASAAVGAVIGLAVGGSSPWLAALAAIVTAGVAAGVILLAGGGNGRIQTVTVLLAGIAVGAFAGAVLAVLVTALGNPGMRSLTFWLTGSLALSTWGNVWPLVLATLLGIVLAVMIARSLDVLSLGDRAAASAGVAVTRVRTTAMIVVVLLIGPAVAITGVIAFVGLVVPHALRLVIGPSHRLLIPASALAGAALIVLADTAARTIANPVELPLGAITAAVGAPIFFVLLLTTRRQQGGWG